MPPGNLNSGRSRNTDDLKVRPLKVKRKIVIVATENRIKILFY
jgi:hypothetical protein